MEPRELVRLGAAWLPLDSRLQSVVGGLGDGDGVGGAVWWGIAGEGCGEAGNGGGLLSADIGYDLWRCGGDREAVGGERHPRRRVLRFVRQTSFLPLSSHFSPLKSGKNDGAPPRDISAGRHKPCM